MNFSGITLSLVCFGEVKGEVTDDDDDDERGRRPIRVAGADSISSVSCLRRMAFEVISMQSRHTGAGLCRKRVRMIAAESIVLGEGGASLVLLFF